MNIVQLLRSIHPQALELRQKLELFTDEEELAIVLRYARSLEGMVRKTIGRLLAEELLGKPPTSEVTPAAEEGEGR